MMKRLADRGMSSSFHLFHSFFSTQENLFVRQRCEASSDPKNMQLMVSSMKINIKNQNHMRQLKDALEMEY